VTADADAVVPTVIVRRFTYADDDKKFGND
jgi:hypothetical protein